MRIANGLMSLSAEMMRWFEDVIFVARMVCLSEVLVDWSMEGDAVHRLVMGGWHGNGRQKNNRESRFIFHGAQGRTRTDTPCGGGFWVPCVYQFRHLGSGFGLLENDIIKHKYSVSTNFCKNIKKDGWYWSVLNKNSDLIWVKKVGVTMEQGVWDAIRNKICSKMWLMVDWIGLLHVWWHVCHEIQIENVFA